MKKIMFVFIFLIVLTGCNKKQVDITYDNSYYNIASPYKKAISDYTSRSYDKVDVERMLMNLSTNYFKPNNSLYEEGQYLSTEEIKKLLAEYNDTEEIKIDGKTIKPSYITTIYEQDYLTTNYNLKGISLAIVVNNVQSNKTIDENIVLDFAKEKANDLLKYMNDKVKTRIVIGIYLESTTRGTFKYIGESNKTLEFKKLNYEYKNLESNDVMNKDMDSYNNILALKNALEAHNLYINPMGLYNDNKLVEVSIIITKSNYKRSEMLAIFSELTNYIKTFDVEVNVYLKSNNDIKAYLNKRDNNVQTYIMEEL